MNKELFYHAHNLFKRNDNRIKDKVFAAKGEKEVLLAMVSNFTVKILNKRGNFDTFYRKI